MAAGQLVTILECLVLSYRICTPAPAPIRGGWAGIFRSEAASSTGGKFPFPHQVFNCEVAWMWLLCPLCPPLARPALCPPCLQSCPSRGKAEELELCRWGQLWL